VSGPTPATRETVALRAHYQCERCYTPVHGQASVHHRRPRRMGGTRRSDSNEPANLLLLCGSGTTGCHGWVEAHRRQSLDHGIILYDRDIPVEHPFRDGHGNWWILGNDGTKHASNPRAESGVGSDDLKRKGNQVTIAVDTASKNDLESVKELTMQIRQRQRDIEEISHSRRSIIQRLRDSKVTYREIAEAMGTTEQNVYKILREYIAQQNAANAT